MVAVRVLVQTWLAHLSVNALKAFNSMQMGSHAVHWSRVSNAILTWYTTTAESDSGSVFDSAVVYLCCYVCPYILGIMILYSIISSLLSLCSIVQTLRYSSMRILQLSLMTGWMSVSPQPLQLPLHFVESILNNLYNVIIIIKPYTYLLILDFI